jgi:carbon-monoxide dehydrogenase small subunit
MEAVTEPVESLIVRLTINGEEASSEVSVRKLLCDFIREDLLLVGTHVGCEHGVCGACTGHCCVG